MNQPTEKGKTRAIIAHITLIGWIIAVIMNNNDKDEFASFYIRQMLGVVVLSIAISAVGSLIPLLGMFLPLVAVVLWVFSLVGAIQGEKKPLPVIGDTFQDWFRTL